MKEKVSDFTLWRTHFGRGYEPLIRETTYWECTHYGRVASL